jgi:hypothetical protein
MQDGGRTSVTKRPHWTAILLGRLAERFCPYAKAPCPEENCKLKEFCKCAQEQARAARKLEAQLWGTLAVSCLLAVAMFWFFKP